MRRTLAELDPHRPITVTSTADDLYESGARGRTATARYFGIFAVVAMALAAAGTFGVMSFFVGQRMRELGIRVALGAGRRSVGWLVLRKGLFLAGAGTGIGLLGVLAVSGVLGSLLYGVGALDPVCLAAAALGLGLIALATSGLPAFRASRADSVEVIRAE